MDERKILMVNETIGGVRFENLPMSVNPDGKIAYPLNSWAVAELIANKIHEDVKGIVTVDFGSVDVGHFLRELNNGETFCATEDPEQKLMDYIFGASTTQAGDQDGHS